ncbi:succinate dehydrogenase [Diaphorobacter sp. HDW4A]|uniref:succinate dehydrogenase n=1 Tax=Diaphorobacter sp. HDW4A TaxID=2714924 RepID=UPI0014085381|nr:succinate dehydrogenase [Diaphorobacter sp. HDW4A]QIL81185.1 succinate dehydrogenase [Diaphorobacter sp. HDW4A]
MEARLFALQRFTAMLMAPFVMVHVAVIIYAVQGGLTAGEILSRTKGNWIWILFYGLFVLSVALHVPIGIRNVLVEWLRLGRGVAFAISALFGCVLLVLGWRAVAVVGGLVS